MKPCILFVVVLHQLGPSRLQAYNDDKDDSELVLKLIELMKTISHQQEYNDDKDESGLQ